MSKCRIIGAGSAGSLAYNTNVNLNTAGGSKKQGFPTTLGDPLINKHEIASRATGLNRNVIFTINQLGGFHTALLLRGGVHPKAPYIYRPLREPDPETNFMLDYLIIGGGGGGGVNIGGGGGAGGYIEGQRSMRYYQIPFPCSVGNGGAPNVSGQNSYFDNRIAIGGGRGGFYISQPYINGANGGSGGGSRGTRAIGVGLLGQGNNGANSTVGESSGGGGGAGSPGIQANPTQNGNGGSGKASSITGTLIYRAGGGGGTGGGFGAASSPSGGSGGIGGGGNGGISIFPYTAGTNGTANTGGGGGGGAVDNFTALAGSGGSGVIIFKYFHGTIHITGLTYTTSKVGEYTVTTLTSGTGSVRWTL